jgi:hypothetical protein
MTMGMIKGFEAKTLYSEDSKNCSRLIDLMKKRTIRKKMVTSAIAMNLSDDLKRTKLNEANAIDINTFTKVDMYVC